MMVGVDETAFCTIGAHSIMWQRGAFSNSVRRAYSTSVPWDKTLVSLTLISADLLM